MVACKQCESMNSLDSAFCKKCGDAMPAEEVQAARLKLEELTKEGFHIFNEGRVDEAIMVAESALLSDPNYTQALSLKGMCLERQGKLPEALEAFEQIAELNPESTLDRIKVTTLRNKLAESVVEEPVNYGRRLAFAGAAATTVLVIAVGALLGAMNANAADPVAKNAVVGKADVGLTSPLTQVAQEETQAKQPVETPSQQPPPVAQPNPDEVRDPVLPPPAPNGQPSNLNGEIPGLQGDGNKPLTLNITPVQPTPPTSTPVKPTVPDDEEPQPITKPAEEPKKAPQVIEINVSSNANRNVGGGQAVDNENRAQALTKTAESKFLANRYDEAAQAYQSALQAGAPAGKTHQRLGDCYKHMGRRDSAITAYSRAAEAYEASGNKRAADVCRQAVKDLGG